MNISYGKRHLTDRWFIRTVLLASAITMAIAFLAAPVAPDNQWVSGGIGIVISVVVTVVTYVWRALRVPVCTWCAAHPGECPGGQFGQTLTIEPTSGDPS